MAFNATFNNISAIYRGSQFYSLYTTIFSILRSIIIISKRKQYRKKCTFIIINMLVHLRFIFIWLNTSRNRLKKKIYETLPLTVLLDIRKMCSKYTKIVRGFAHCTPTKGPPRTRRRFYAAETSKNFLLCLASACYFIGQRAYNL